MSLQYSLQSYPSPPVDNRPGIRFDRRIDIENFSLIAREGHEASFFWKKDSWNFLLRVVGGHVEVRFNNPLSELDVELTFLDSRKFVLWRARQKGGGGERVIHGPLSEDIVEHLRGTGGDLLLSFLFLKPHQNYPTSPIPALEGLGREDPPSSIEPETPLVTETNPGGRFSWSNDQFEFFCSGAIGSPLADKQNRQYQLQPEYASFTTSLDVYPTIERRRLLLPNYGHPFPYLKPRRPPSARLISAMEGLLIGREEPRNPPSSNEPEDGFNDYLIVQRRKLPRQISRFPFPDNKRPTSDRPIPNLKSLLIGREKPPNPSIEPEKESNDCSTNRSLLRPRLPRHFNRCPTSDQLIPAMEGLIGQQEPPLSSQPVATPLTNVPEGSLLKMDLLRRAMESPYRPWNRQELPSFSEPFQRHMSVEKLIMEIRLRTMLRLPDLDLEKVEIFPRT